MSFCALLRGAVLGIKESKDVKNYQYHDASAWTAASCAVGAMTAADPRRLGNAGGRVTCVEAKLIFLPRSLDLAP